MDLKIKKIHSDATIPTRQTVGSAGYDLYSYCPGGIILSPGKPEFIPTGLSMEIPDGHDVEIRPRSGLSTKNMIIMPNSPGTIDSDYRGEIMVCLVNLSNMQFIIHHNMRIAQMILRKNLDISFVLVDTLNQTERGQGGFGSTGTA